MTGSFAKSFRANKELKVENKELKVENFLGTYV